MKTDLELAIRHIEQQIKDPTMTTRMIVQRLAVIRQFVDDSIKELQDRLKIEDKS